LVRQVVNAHKYMIYMLNINYGGLAMEAGRPLSDSEWLYKIRQIFSTE
jgi:hypothetical protein